MPPSSNATIRSAPSCIDECSCNTPLASAGAGDGAGTSAASGAASPAGFSRHLLTGFGAVLGVVVLVVVLAEWLGLLEKVSDLVPWPVWLAGVLAGGYPVFRSVLRAALRRRVTILMPAAFALVLAAGLIPAPVQAAGA
jgi:Cu+-exporting ATPase